MMKTASFSWLRHPSPWPTYTHKLCLLPWHTSLSASRLSVYILGQRPEEGATRLSGSSLYCLLWTSLQGWLLILESVNAWFSQSVMVTRNLSFSSMLLALPLPWLLMEGEWHLTCLRLPFLLLGHPGTFLSVLTEAFSFNKYHCAGWTAGVSAVTQTRSCLHGPFVAKLLMLAVSWYTPVF